MIAEPAGLVGPAKEAGIAIPEDLEEFDPEEYPHWDAFCTMQLGRPMPNASCHWENAKVIARIPLDKIKTITIREMLNMGFQ